MNPQPDTLHDRAWHALTGRREPWGGCAERETVDRIVALVLAETATAQPEADERAPMDVFQFAARRSQADAALAAAQPVEPACIPSQPHGDGPISDSMCALHGRPWPCLRAQPVEPADLAHVEPAICDGSDRCPAAHHVHGCYADTGACESPDEHPPVEPEPRPRVEWKVVEGVRILMPVSESGEREALARLVAAASYKRLTFRGQADAILAAGFRRSRPEATHTVTAEQVEYAEMAVVDVIQDEPPSAFRSAETVAAQAVGAVLAALGVTVADTPGS